MIRFDLTIPFQSHNELRAASDPQRLHTVLIFDHLNDNQRDIIFGFLTGASISQLFAAGILPGIRWLAARPRRPKLAISLNAPDQERRRDVMPISARYPLEALMEAVRAFPLERGRRITFEYVLIRDFNDGRSDPALRVLGPVDAPMARRAGRYRAQLLLQAGDRRALHAALRELRRKLEEDPAARKVRWSIDVDPVDMS